MLIGQLIVTAKFEFKPCFAFSKVTCLECDTERPVGISKTAVSYCQSPRTKELLSEVIKRIHAQHCATVHSFHPFPLRLDFVAINVGVLLLPTKCACVRACSATTE